MEEAWSCRRRSGILRSPTLQAGSDDFYPSLIAYAVVASLLVEFGLPTIAANFVGLRKAQTANCFSKLN